MAAHRMPAMFIEVSIGGAAVLRAPLQSFAHGLKVRIKAGDGKVLQTVAVFRGVQTPDGPEIGVYVGPERVDNLHNLNVPTRRKQ